MLLFYLFSLLLCVYESQQEQLYNWEKYRSEETAGASHNRIIELMRSYYEEAHSRTTRLNPMRFMYEESPYYEMGYITGEIIERYRKVLEHSQRPVRFPGMPLYDVIKRVEYVQKLYFEIYHLVRMMHETPRKWGAKLEFNNITVVAGFHIVAGVKSADIKDETGSVGTGYQPDFSKNRDRQRQRERERKKLRKAYLKIRQAYLEKMQKPDVVKKKYNRWWPIDYGWEIDYWW